MTAGEMARREKMPMEMYLQMDALVPGWARMTNEELYNKFVASIRDLDPAQLLLIQGLLDYWDSQQEEDDS